MIFWFSGTGNSKYAAQRMAEALNEPLLCMNDRIKAHDTATVETGERLVIVTPTYAWRIPRLVRDWLLQTELRGARQAWFVMTCGSEIGSADNISLQNGRPVWGGSCTHCMACICRCPAEAIEYGRKSRGKPRYHFEAL